MASTISLVDLGTADISTTHRLMSGNITITNDVDAPVVQGGKIIADTNRSNGTIGWNPLGTTASSSSQWISIGGVNGTASGGGSSYVTLTLNEPETAIKFIWGSPSATNTVSLYSGANGTGQLLGTVTANGDGTFTIVSYDSKNKNKATTTTFSAANLANVTSTGALVSITSTTAFKSAVFSTQAGSGGFEISRISAVPLPAALPLFGSALIGLGALARRRIKSRKTA
ncbi:MAG TPA: VPLPA-CTERM sorting domain-containing protein [Candidatus Sulfotelmatobacter sp.]|jgi:hypothetical protein|nr:VPLPA-CTERM sorting domain-containing protein [Candidatus Sulfotelmatobacter sp.]